MLVAPPRPRATFEDGPGELRVRMPSVRHPGFGVLWVAAVAMIAVFSRDLFTQLRDPETFKFALGTLVFLTIWGAGALVTALRLFWGWEVIVLRSDSLTIRREIGGIGRQWTYALSAIRNLRISPQVPNPFGSSTVFMARGRGTGWIAFDYGSQTVCVGAGVDEAEARLIIDRLGERQHALLGR